MYSLTNSILSLFVLTTSIAFAGEPQPLQLTNDHPIDLWSSARPDGHAPIGVMGDHGHGKGEWMLSYRYMNMPMEQNYDGSSRISDSEILSPTGGNYLVAPQWMDMEMHMLGLMISPIDHLTLMLMIPYASKEMGHLRRDGVEFLTKSEGWGDLKLSGIYELYHGHRTTWLLNLGLSLPTGSTSEEDFIPGPGETRLPYPMQIGSGTWDLLPGITYLGQADTWSWGAQLSGVIRLGENNEGYTLGNVGQLTAWGAYKWNDHVSTSLRATGKAWGALGMGASSRLLRERLSDRPAFISALTVASEGRFIPVPGGVLIRDADGGIVGAVAMMSIARLSKVSASPTTIACCCSV